VAEHTSINAFLAAFKQGLQEFGWIEDHNIQIVYRWAAADVERMQAFAKDLVSLRV
jgi:putative tryptophan/tyrosine transport system substrate-binding protein